MSAHRPEVGATGAPIAWAAAAGLLGLLPGPAGWADAVLVLAWLSLLAPAAGLAAGVSAKSGLLRALLRHLLPLGAWGLVLAFALAAGPRMPPTPLAALGVVAGLYLGGLCVHCSWRSIRMKWM